MKTVWKFELRVADTQVVRMPQGAEVIHGTGHVLGDVGKYLGSILLNEGTLVFHVFDCAS